MDTGGRTTRQTNDLTLGYARARRDLSCRYTLGFYDREAGERRRRELRVQVTRPGLRVLHAAGYAFRDPADKRASGVRAAFLSPGSFTGGVVRAHLFPLRPVSARSWDCLLVVDFPVTLPAGDRPRVERAFGVVVSSSSEAVHALDRRIALRAREAVDPRTRRVSFVEHVELEPGPYTLNTVMTDDGDPVPYAHEVRVGLPEIPRRELFLVGPLLGRRASGNVVVIGGDVIGDGETRPDDPRDRIGTPASFEPLLVRRTEGDEALLALTQACRVKGGGKVDARRVRRILLGPDGEAVGSLPAVDLALERHGAVRCQTVVDVLPTAPLAPGRYVFRAVVDREGSGTDDAAEVPFAVARPRPGSDTDTESASLR